MGFYTFSPQIQFEKIACKVTDLITFFFILINYVVKQQKKNTSLSVSAGILTFCLLTTENIIKK